MSEHNTMWAARLYGVGDLRVEAVEAARILAPDEALIRIHACGICPSDLRSYTGVRASHRDGHYTPGHEWAGEIVAVGAEVEGFAVGDRVAPSWRVVCGRCYYCVRGIWNYCESLARGVVRGGFCELGAATVRSLYRIPEGVSYREACFSEPLACCINGSRWSQIPFGGNVVIVGAGPIGLIHLQLAKLAGARTIVSELSSARLAVAEQLGADALVDAAHADPVAQVRELTGGYGADTVIVAVGAPAALQQALEMAGLCATVNYFAGTYPATTIPLDPNLIHYKQIRLTGSHDYGPLDFGRALELIARGSVQVAPLISHELPLERVKEGFDIVREQRGLKVVIRMEA
ncbi:MAG: zinc-binding dehydrogenase [Anaerolineae bacterium]|nr:zinc-binding dehydrogenase [Anaerolineae bacterium]